jgi:acyl-homoserine lactone acylase PvdQ
VEKNIYWFISNISCYLFNRRLDFLQYAKFIISATIFRRNSYNKIKSTIEVYRDSFAVPYIIAENDEDAAFALGFLHAQERMFTMDLIRRAGEGRLSEILGEKAIPFDRMFRTVGIKRNIEKNLYRYNADVMKILQAYSNGVNAFLKDQRKLWN